MTRANFADISFLTSKLRTGAAKTPHLKAALMGKGNNSQKNDKKNKKVKKDDKKPAGKTPTKK